ncbi:MAG: hypothetical protein ACLT1W_00965 [Alistipes onderdonkii]
MLAPACAGFDEKAMRDVGERPSSVTVKVSNRPTADEMSTTFEATAVPFLLTELFDPNSAPSMASTTMSLP